MSKFELPPGDAVGRHRIEVSRAEYHADVAAINKSLLDEVERSPAHARRYLDQKRKPRTRALELGDIVHAMVLEPDLVSSQFIAPEKVLDARKAYDRAVLEEWELIAQDRGKTLIRREVYDQAAEIREAVFQSRTARGIFSKGEPEATFVWRDQATGLVCKCRVDWLRDGFLTDVKTAADASPRAFGRAALNHRYDVQDAHYIDGVGDDELGFVFLVVETTPPYPVAIYADNPGARRLGRQKRDRNLATLLECHETNRWPGYPDEVQVLKLPAYAFHEEELDV